MYEEEMKQDLVTMRNFLGHDNQHVGNLGTFRLSLSYPQSPQLYGEKVFGASYLLYQDLRDAIRYANAPGYQIITNAATETEFVIDPASGVEIEKPTAYVIYRHVIKLGEGEDARIVREQYEATPTPGNDRNYDSEYFILNHAQEIIDQEKPDQVAIELLTERSPCSSCTKIIVDFLNENLNAKISVYYINGSPTPGGIPHPRSSLSKV